MTRDFDFGLKLDLQSGYTNWWLLYYYCGSHKLVIITRFTTVQVQSESKIKIFGQNQVYGEDLRSLLQKTKNWGNNQVSRRCENKYSFQVQDSDLALFLDIGDKVKKLSEINHL